MGRGEWEWVHCLIMPKIIYSHSEKKRFIEYFLVTPRHIAIIIKNRYIPTYFE